MVWIAAIRRPLAAFGRWLERQWCWLALGGALAISFLFGTSIRRRTQTQTGTVSDDEAQRQREDIEREASSHKEEIVAAAAKDRTAEITSEKDAVEDCDDDTRKTNTYVRAVGEDMRK